MTGIGVTGCTTQDTCEKDTGQSVNLTLDPGSHMEVLVLLQEMAKASLQDPSRVKWPMGIHHSIHEGLVMVSQALSMTTGRFRLGPVHQHAIGSAALVLQEHLQDPALARTM